MSNCKDYNNLNWISGDTETLELLMKDDDGNEIDLNGYTGKMQLTRNKNEEFYDIAAKYSTYDEETKIMKFEFESFETINLSLNGSNTSYFYDVQIESSDGNVETILDGKVYVKKGIS